VRGTATLSDVNLAGQRDVVNRFLAALRAGDVEGVVAVLDPGVVVRVDAAAATSGQPVEVRGARMWATGAMAFARAVQAAQRALVNGSVGLVLAPGGRLSRVLSITIADGRIAHIDIIAGPARLRTLNLAVL
jgi:RNA polymerase sigma-70 factor (ECF subfamily)